MRGPARWTGRPAVCPIYLYSEHLIRTALRSCVRVSTFGATARVVEGGGAEHVQSARHAVHVSALHSASIVSNHEFKPDL